MKYCLTGLKMAILFSRKNDASEDEI